MPPVGGLLMRQCPLTCGLPTRMTLGGWSKACAARRNLNEKFSEHSADVHVMFCRECQGRIKPTELEIITIEELSVGRKPSGEKQWVMPAELAEVLRPMSVNEAKAATIKGLAGFWRRPLIRSTHPSECPCCGGVHRLKNSGVCSGCNSDKVVKLGLEGFDLLAHLAKRAKGATKIKPAAEKIKESITPATEPPPPSAHPAVAGAVDVVGLQGRYDRLVEERDCLQDILVDVGQALDGGEEENLPLVVVRRMGELAEARDTIRRQVEMIAQLKARMAEAIAEATADAVVAKWSCLSEPSGYEALSSVLQEAIDQAALGKGLERHADGRPFHDQPIMRETLAVGLGFPAGQARKKILEAVRCCDEHPERAVADLLGAINYIAALVIALRLGMEAQAA